MAKERSAIHNAYLMSFALADPNSMGVHKALQEVYPALAAKLFEGNQLMHNLVMSGHNMMHIMDYPVCGTCESLALYNETGMKDGKRVPKCTCIRAGCGATTIMPATLRQWLAYELRQKMPPEEIDGLEYKIDRIAQKMLDVHKQNMRKAYMEHNARAREKMKADKVKKPVLQVEPDEPVIRHNTPSKLPADTVWVPDSIKGDDDDV
jgi:hypothetical protein